MTTTEPVRVCARRVRSRLPRLGRGAIGMNHAVAKESPGRKRRVGHDDDRSAHQQTIVIVVEPVGRRGRFRARLDGRVIVAASTQPFLDAARILIARGCDPSAVMEMHHQGTTAFAMRGPLRVAARLDVKDARFVKHRPRADGHGKADASLVGAADEP